MYTKEFIELVQTNKIKEISALFNVNDVYNINQISRIKEQYPEYPINDILSLIKLQKQFQSKLRISEDWVITDKNGQQASSYLLAKYHGLLYSGFTSVADLCCGIGMDLFFLSQGKERSYAIDLNPEILLFAKYNMQLMGRDQINYLQMKAQDFNEEVESVFIDPDRRSDQVRSVSPHLMSPNLSEIEVLLDKYPTMGIKLSPMIDYDKYDIFKTGELHFISENNELKEIFFCTGKLCIGYNKQCRILNKDLTFRNNTLFPIKVESIKEYLIEPDVSIIKSHLVEALASEINATKIDEKLALLSSNMVIEHEFSRYYKVNDIFDFSIKSLNKYLKDKEIGYLDIKTRGFSETVEAFRKKLKIKGKSKACLFIIRLQQKHYFVICDFKRQVG